MSHISKPVDWEVFNIPPIQPVQYYSILKRKRDFSEFIKQYDAQVFKHRYLHFCGIVPKNISSSISNRYEIIIVFFDEIPNNSFIGFRVKASKETFTYETNSLLLFLKKSKKAVFYLMNNNCIHVQCGTNAWELFYLLYDDYLRKYVLTIIGTQFFYHFVYSHCIERETQLLELLYKGSKIIRVSKNSIYYKMHRKRKISVTDLIHMTVNMPKSKRYIISSFNSKESLFYPDFEDGDFYTSVGSKINVSKLVLKKIKKPFQSLLSDRAKNAIIFEDVPVLPGSVSYPHSEILVSKYEAKSDGPLSSNNTTVKRKFIEIENYKQGTEPEPSTSKFIKTSDLSSVEIYEDQWRQYQNLKPVSVNCYSGIPSINNLVPNLLNRESSDFINSSFYLMDTDCSVPAHSSTKMNEESVPKVIEISGEMDNINSSNSQKTDDIETTEVIPENSSSSKFNKPFDSVLSKNSLQNLKKNPLCLNTGILDSTDKISPTALIKSKNVNEVYISIGEDASFTTAAGKSINISDTAMITANKLIQDMMSDGNQDALHEKVNYDLNKTSSFRSNYPDFRKKPTNIPLAKNSLNKPAHGIKIKNNDIPAKKFEAVLPPKVTENFSQDRLEDASFTTAAGKVIQVSNNAMQAAHKLLQNVFNEENKPMSNSVNSAKNANPFIEDIGSSSRKSVDESIDVDMDKTLVEKFFEDTLFDEKELESTTECNKNENSDSTVVSKTDNNLPPRKPRKSLGGRRSMRYCSAKL